MHPQPKHSFTGRISFLLVASVMEGVFSQIYLSVLTNDQSWPFNCKIKSPGGLSVKHFKRNTTLGFISTIITFTSGARNQFLGEDLFSLEHHQSPEVWHAPCTHNREVPLGCFNRPKNAQNIPFSGGQQQCMCNISLFFSFRLGRCITASDV